MSLPVFQVSRQNHVSDISGHLIYHPVFPELLVGSRSRLVNLLVVDDRCDMGPVLPVIECHGCPIRRWKFVCAVQGFLPGAFAAPRLYFDYKRLEHWPYQPNCKYSAQRTILPDPSLNTCDLFNPVTPLILQEGTQLGRGRAVAFRTWPSVIGFATAGLPHVDRLDVEHQMSWLTMGGDIYIA